MPLLAYADGWGAVLILKSHEFERHKCLKRYANLHRNRARYSRPSSLRSRGDCWLYASCPALRFVQIERSAERARPLDLVDQRRRRSSQRAAIAGGRRCARRPPARAAAAPRREGRDAVDAGRATRCGPRGSCLQDPRHQRSHTEGWQKVVRWISPRI